MNKAETSGAGVEQSTPPVAPTETSNEGGEDEAHTDDQVEIPLEDERKGASVIGGTRRKSHATTHLVLPLDDLVAREIRDIGRSNLAAGLDEHPPDVGPPES